MEKTIEQFDALIASQTDFFAKNIEEYFTPLEIFGEKTIRDLIYEIAWQTRDIEEGKLIGDYLFQFKRLIDYSVIALLKTEFNLELCKKFDTEKFTKNHLLHLKEAKELMQRKNHDYGEAWRSMRITSMTDLILMKLIRVKQIQENDGKTLVSEGTPANFYDIINYSFFALILLSEKESQPA